eukprot:TRINITY_DN5947_c0_g2_i2.p1 TRINITY_DN5947_c0_g2~~TRINITY_DN5947_c0_g2_i2.p1  ORF type:complete len:106 (+),score=12.84 TRINITY_DN5947_c0_g2_i2:42-359(+)
MCIRDRMNTFYFMQCTSYGSQLRQNQVLRFKRYSEFSEFNSKISQELIAAGEIPPDFPKKKAFNKLDGKLIEIRRRKLEIYMNDLGSMQVALASFEFLSFLGLIH